MAIAVGCLLFVAAFRPWQPLADTSPMTWVNTVAYVVACLACVLAFLRERRSARNHAAAAGRVQARPGVWLGCSLLLLLFLANKQLDLQILLTNAGRSAFLTLGLYARRRLWQSLGLVALLAIGLVFGKRWFLGLRRFSRRYWLAFVGIAGLLGLCVVRAISLHQSDVILGTRLFGFVKVYGALELLDILLVMLVAISASAAPNARG